MKEIIWRDGVITSTQFDDGYFSHEDGFAETQYVFLGGNGLPTRWVGKDTFTIAELGFGTGLNFLTTWRAWRQSNPTGTLRYVGFEKFPLDAAHMRQALAQWADVQPFQEELLEQELPQEEGWHVIKLSQAELHLAIGDAIERLPEWEGAADAWYLDGFAPARNPELWGLSLMENIFAHTKPEGTVATYSAAGMVRRNLQTAGFVVNKRDGFGRKREMLTGLRPAGVVAPTE